MDDIISFGRWLKLRRIALYLTQDGLGQLVGCTAITIRKIEADERRPSPQLAEKLAHHLDLAPNDRALFLRAARAEFGAMRLPPPTAPALAAIVRAGRRDALPTPVTPLIGREHLVAQVVACMLRSDVRLATLIGPGGVGKTRVAIESALQLGPAFAGGTSFVVLAPVGNASLLLPTIAQALEVKEAGARPLIERLSVHLAPRALLLVLDNFEHLAAAAPVVALLLAAAPRLKVLVTSRMPLHISGEHEIAVPPLTEQDSLQLFVARSQAVRPDFVLSGADVQAAIAICRRLDRLPLAIELAAARSRLLTPQVLLAHLNASDVPDRSALWLLTGGPADLPARQQTLRSTIAWSHNLLTTDERQLFARLGVFAGGFTIEATAALTIEDLRAVEWPSGLQNGFAKLQQSTLDLLISLLEQSLLRCDVDSDGELRFTMLETIREYALEQLAASREMEAIQLQHATFFLNEAEAAERQFHSAKQHMWVERLTADLDNMRAALGWALERSSVESSATQASGRAEIGLRLAWALTVFWFWRGHFTEGGIWLTRALERREGTAELAQARVLLGAGLLAHHLADHRRMTALLEEALALFRRQGDRLGCAESLLYLGLVALDRCDYSSGEPLIEEGLRLYRELDSPISGLALLFLGGARYAQGDLAGAEVCLLESLAIVRDAGDPWLTGIALNDLAKIELSRGDDQRAEELLGEALTLLRAIGTPWGVADALRNLGYVASQRGEYLRALDLFRESLQIRWDLGSTSAYAPLLEALASLAPAHLSCELRARLLGAAAALRGSLGTPLPPIERTAHQRLLDAIRDQLGELAFAVAWAAGQALTVNVAIAEALGVVHTAPSGTSPDTQPDERYSVNC